MGEKLKEIIENTVVHIICAFLLLVVVSFVFAPALAAYITIYYQVMT